MRIFEGLPEFLAVAEFQSFTAAAKTLGVSVALVSRRVSALEERLGLQLVARTTRRVRLTNSGFDYFQHCSEMVQRLEEKNVLVSGQQSVIEGRLRVSVAGHFAERHVIPALVEFMQDHPKLKIEIDFDSRHINFVDDVHDFAIRAVSDPKDSSLIFRRLAENMMAAAASAEYFRANGQPETPDDLTQHQCLVLSDHTVWKFSDDDGVRDVRMNTRWICNDARAILSACRAGMGIAYMNQAGFGNALEKGELVKTLEDYWGPGRTSWIVYPSRKFLPARARFAIEFLLKKFESLR